ncbi:hypothetical protein NLU13_8565 [Sarocladium strictum]|uniref:DUF6594 domain-containing protein n=1 Tax=Sarocladium strictum TaxID=5046 RepID=A0AA39GCM2_SARSR|nr:hypothetical protein NLU13_8565 [Sarocladium strictum]
MSEVIVLAQPPETTEMGRLVDASASGATSAPPDEASASEESRHEMPVEPTEPALPSETTAPHPTDAEEKAKVVPRPVTVEDVPEPEPEPEPEAADGPTLETQTREPAPSGEVHLTPKVSVLTATASPTPTEANTPLQLLPDLVASPALSEQPLASTVGSVPKSPQEKPGEARELHENPVSDVGPLGAPSALSFLDADSPPVTKEAIRQSTLNAARRGLPGAHDGSSSSYSHSSMGSAAYSSDVFSRAVPRAESLATWSPSGPYSLKAEGHPPVEHHTPEFHRPWTSPESRMPPPPMSHIEGSSTQPRFPAPSPFPFNEHVPSSGYQLLATKLAGDLGGMQIKPIYRRFEALNHRLLLSLQNEIQNLEEQLHGIDSADTQNRTYPGGIYPASLRHEAASGSELYWRKTEVLTQIGYRLHQYNKLLVSFRDTTDLPAPTIPDIQDYKAFLNQGNYIIADEARFLSATNDLISLDEAMLRGTDEFSEDLLTPMPRSTAEQEFPILIKSGAAGGEKVSTPAKPITPVESPEPALPPAAITRLALAIFIAVLVPIFTFTVIPDFAGRITVVALVASSVLSTLLQSGLIGLLAEDRGVLVMVLCVIVYGGVMAAAAATFH